jgi:hypothetical protein
LVISAVLGAVTASLVLDPGGGLESLLHTVDLWYGRLPPGTAAQVARLGRAIAIAAPAVFVCVATLVTRKRRQRLAKELEGPVC